MRHAEDRVHILSAVVEAIEEIRDAAPPSSIGLLAVQRKAEGDVIGYCGLANGGPGTDDEPKLAYELLRRSWGQGFATEATWAVLDWAKSSGHERLWATVWDWNAASRQVLAKVGFTGCPRAMKFDASTRSTAINHSRPACAVG